ncbi:Putative 3-methyladenine DNA glycosylase [Acaryochloris thomasi RCC1774]|uniref:Putative 3-methyladenine DNA glycosylase n=1 Tax=Acaryochloris thomasi RCC1774 TaxID=1764569 RepID=A0A2W1JM69_9CYAN|nr:DNA-3-methyladenine glycosylase [Acaryochloris thomasi]PZD74306.1 Putative 3-methyladenine DNA glycosylase [Acaryochloris thomasi RCC1774]
MTQISDAIDAAWLSRPADAVAPDLVGCQLVRALPNGDLVRGLIVETEAYGPGDPACHAYRRRTPRNAVMFGPAGMTYVYLIYGMYHCLNVVTDQDEVPSAVLIRALKFEEWPHCLDVQTKQPLHRIAAGPGKLCRVLDINREFSGIELKKGQPLWLEHRSVAFAEAVANAASPLTTGQTKADGTKPSQESSTSEQLVQTTRIGLTQGVDIPWRWYLKDCRAVSKL